ncbi:MULTISPECIES: VOC family protein [Arthrobacter]|uniref:VOC family protein n=2 Tax=Arthrobacter TaxID=1663 RepID=A0ABU9KHR6_9MICC|nr:VOC family protein [Arthrobacter sp. YJM1]MDP5226562.1 VOC family protein [Arthrobacter sp. YJM1]
MSENTAQSQNTAPSENTAPRTAATGRHTTDGMPHGRTSITPHVVVSPATKALEFYRDVFGAVVVSETRMGELIGEAELRFTSGGITIGDPMPEFGLVAPQAGGTSMSLALYVADVDAVVALAEAAGATIREAPADFVSGDRYASILDPFGVRWAVMTRVEDLSTEESARRVHEWAAGFSG